MIRIINTQTNIEYDTYSVRFHATGNNINGVLDASGNSSLPPDGIYKIPSFNDTLIQIKSYDQMMKNLGIDYSKDNFLDFYVVLPQQNQS